MSASERLSLLVSLDANGAIKGFEKVSDSAEKELNKAQQRIDKLSGQMTRFGAAGLAASVVAGRGLYSLAQSASSLQESISKANVVFGENAQEVKAWAKTSATAFGQSEAAALEAAGTYGNLFQAFGIGRKPATEMSKTLVELAADLASFNNTSVEDAILALRSGLSGETEPLKRYGVALSDVRLKQEAMSLGLIKSTSEALTPAAKAQASYALIMKDTVLAQGDFARTSDGAANQQRILAAQLENFKTQLGTGVLPVMSEGVGMLNALFGAANSLGPGVTQAAGGFAAFATVAVGSLSAVSLAGGQLIKMKERFTVAGDASGVFGTNLSKTGVAAIGVTSALSVGTIVLQKYADNKQRAAEATAGFTKSLLADGGALGDNTKKTILATIENTKLEKKLADSGVTIDALAAALNVQSGKTDQLSEATAAAAKEQLAKLDLNGEEARTLVELIATYGDAVRSTDAQAKITEDSTVSTKANTAAVQDAKKAEEEHLKAIQEKADAISGAIRADIDYAQATRESDAKLKELTDTLKKSKAGSVEAMQATEDYKTAVLDQADALVKLREEQAAKVGVELTDIDKARERIAVYQEQANQLAPGSPLRASLEGWIADLKTIPGVVETEVRVKLNEADWLATKNKLEKAFGPNKALANYELNSSYKRASGGPLFGGQTALVGENGPEVIQLGRQQTANVTPLSKVPSVSSAAGMTNVYNISVSTGIGDPNAIARAVKDSLTRFERRSA